METCHALYKILCTALYTNDPSQIAAAQTAYINCILESGALLPYHADTISLAWTWLNRPSAVFVVLRDDENALTLELFVVMSTNDYVASSEEMMEEEEWADHHYNAIKKWQAACLERDPKKQAKFREEYLIMLRSMVETSAVDTQIDTPEHAAMLHALRRKSNVRNPFLLTSASDIESDEAMFLSQVSHWWSMQSKYAMLPIFTHVMAPPIVSEVPLPMRGVPHPEPVETAEEEVLFSEKSGWKRSKVTFDPLPAIVLYHKNHQYKMFRYMRGAVWECDRHILSGSRFMTDVNKDLKLPEGGDDGESDVKKPTQYWLPWTDTLDVAEKTTTVVDMKKKTQILSVRKGICTLLYTMTVQENHLLTPETIFKKLTCCTVSHDVFFALDRHARVWAFEEEFDTSVLSEKLRREIQRAIAIATAGLPISPDALITCGEVHVFGTECARCSELRRDRVERYERWIAHLKVVYRVGVIDEIPMGICSKWNSGAMIAGTTLHRYMESLFTESPEEAAKWAQYLFSDVDRARCDHVYAQLRQEYTSFDAEMIPCSHEYRIAGSLDLVAHREESGKRMSYIFDYKRSGAILEPRVGDPLFKSHPGTRIFTRGDAALKKYAEQLAVYRHLLQLHYVAEGIVTTVSPIATLIVFHPGSSATYNIQIDLENFTDGTQPLSVRVPAAFEQHRTKIYNLYRTKVQVDEEEEGLTPEQLAARSAHTALVISNAVQYVKPRMGGLPYKPWPGTTQVSPSDRHAKKSRPATAAARPPPRAAAQPLLLVAAAGPRRATPTDDEVEDEMWKTPAQPLQRGKREVVKSQAPALELVIVSRRGVLEPLMDPFMELLDSDED